MTSRRGFFNGLADCVKRATLVSAVAPTAFGDLGNRELAIPDLPPVQHLGEFNADYVLRETAEECAVAIRKLTGDVFLRSLDSLAVRGDIILSPPSNRIVLDQHPEASVIVRDAQLLMNPGPRRIYFQPACTGLAEQIRKSAKRGRIVTAKSPVPLPFTGALGTTHSDGYLAVRVVFTYDFSRLMQFATVDVLYGVHEFEIGATR